MFAPYGSTRYSDGIIPTAYNFTGQRLDSQTGLLYYNFRYYDPVSGRFVRADTIITNAQGMDPYAYVSGNPETDTDPTGHSNVEGESGGFGGSAGEGGFSGDAGGGADFSGDTGAGFSGEGGFDASTSSAGDNWYNDGSNSSGGSGAGDNWYNDGGTSGSGDAGAIDAGSSGGDAGGAIDAGNSSGGGDAGAIDVGSAGEPTANQSDENSADLTTLTKEAQKVQAAGQTKKTRVSGAVSNVIDNETGQPLTVNHAPKYGGAQTVQSKEFSWEPQVDKYNASCGGSMMCEAIAKGVAAGKVTLPDGEIIIVEFQERGFSACSECQANAKALAKSLGKTVKLYTIDNSGQLRQPFTFNP